MWIAEEWPEQKKKVGEDDEMKKEDEARLRAHLSRRGGFPARGTYPGHSPFRSQQIPSSAQSLPNQNPPNKRSTSSQTAALLAPAQLGIPSGAGAQPTQRAPAQTKVPDAKLSAKLPIEKGICGQDSEANPRRTVVDQTSGKNRLSGRNRHPGEVTEVVTGRSKMVTRAESRAIMPKTSSHWPETTNIELTAAGNDRMVPQWEMMDESEDMEVLYSDEHESAAKDSEEMKEGISYASHLRSPEKPIPNQRVPKKVKFSNEQTSGETQVKGGFVPLPAQQKEAASPRKPKGRPTRGASPSRTWPRKHMHSYAHTGDSSWTPLSSAHIHDIAVAGNDVAMPDAPRSPPQNPPVDPTIAAPKESDDERSGGWIPMKNFPQYKEPVDPGLDPDHPLQAAYDDDLIWDDIIENSVWRPRRVGEKALKIYLDDDLENFLKISELNFDGGVDCGIEPYPVCTYLLPKELPC